MKLHEQYYVEKAKVEKLIAKKNQKSDFYNGIYDRYTDPVLTREHIPVEWKYDVNPETNPYFMERLGVNAVFNSGAIELNGKYYLIARVEGNDRKSFFGIAECDSPVDGFRFWDYPVLLDDICPEETNVYDMRLTKHADGWIYGVFCSESKDTTVNDLSAAVAAAGIVRTKDLKNWERLPNLVTLNSPQQRNVVLHPEFVDGKYAFYTRPMDDFIETGSGGGIGFGLCEDITHAVIDEEKAKELGRKIKKAEFDYNDFLDQMNQIKKMGGMASIMSMMPGMGQLKGLDLDENEKTMGRVEAIILSMTAEERRNPDLMNPSRKKRIAQGAGVDIAEVNRLVKQFGDMKKLMKQLPGMAGGGKRKGLGGLGGMLGKMKLPF